MALNLHKMMSKIKMSFMHVYGTMCDSNGAWLGVWNQGVIKRRHTRYELLLVAWQNLGLPRIVILPITEWINFVTRYWGRSLVKRLKKLCRLLKNVLSVALTAARQFIQEIKLKKRNLIPRQALEIQTQCADFYFTNNSCSVFFCCDSQEQRYVELKEGRLGFNIAWIAGGDCKLLISSD